MNKEQIGFYTNGHHSEITDDNKSEWCVFFNTGDNIVRVDVAKVETIFPERTYNNMFTRVFTIAEAEQYEIEGLYEHLTHCGNVSIDIIIRIVSNWYNLTDKPYVLDHVYENDNVRITFAYCNRLPILSIQNKLNKDIAMFGLYRCTAYEIRDLINTARYITRINLYDFHNCKKIIKGKLVIIGKFDNLCVNHADSSNECDPTHAEFPHESNDESIYECNHLISVTNNRGEWTFNVYAKDGKDDMLDCTIVLSSLDNESKKLTSRMVVPSKHSYILTYLKKMVEDMSGESYQKVYEAVNNWSTVDRPPEVLIGGDAAKDAVDTDEDAKDGIDILERVSEDEHEGSVIEKEIATRKKMMGILNELSKLIDTINKDEVAVVLDSMKPSLTLDHLEQNYKDQETLHSIMNHNVQRCLALKHLGYKIN